MMKIIGHRGAKGLAPENTVASLLKALEHDVDEIEFDVRVSKDKVPILAHDTHIHDQAGNKLKIHSHSWQELKAHRADLPTLEEAIRAINKRVPLMLEVKPGEPTEPIIKVIKKLLKDGWQAKDFLFVSYSFPILQKLHKALPEITPVVNDLWSGVRATLHARRLGTKRINIYRPWVWGGFIKAMSRRGYQLSVFTGNNRRVGKRWAKYGLYGIITDYPDRFQK